MGDYLKEAYLLAELNKNIDDDYQKLSDKLHDLELSHNRKKKALIEINRIIDEYIPKLYKPNPILYVNLLGRIKRLSLDALWSDGRVYYKPKKKITMRDVKRRIKKGGK